MQTKYPKRYSQVFFSSDGSAAVTDHWKYHDLEDLLCVEDYQFHKDETIYLTQFGMLFGEESVIDSGNGVFAFYVHGCPFRCNFCYQNDFYAPTPKKQVETKKLVKFVTTHLETETPIEFVISTYSEEVTKTCRLIKLENPNKKIVYKFSGILTDEQIENLKDVVDVFVPDFKALTHECADYHGLTEGFVEQTKCTLEKLVTLNKTIIVRHLCSIKFKGWKEELISIEKFLSSITNTAQIYFSILNQFYNTQTKRIESVDESKIEKVLKSAFTPLLISSEVAL